VIPDFDTVRLIDVSRHFGRRRALSRVSLTAHAGDIVGLLGPNGAGKSTLIGVLATLVAPTSGEVRFGDAVARDDPSLRHRLGLLAHELHLYPELTARQNLAFFAQLYGLDPNLTVAAALDRASLADRADDEVSGFSRGMRQRLALERALLHRPRLVLLDEPFTGLDDRAVSVVADRLRRIAADGCIVMMATHDLDLADGLVTRVAVIRGGKLIADEPAGSGLRARYRALSGLSGTSTTPRTPDTGTPGARDTSGLAGTSGSWQPSSTPPPSRHT
jgi:heme exporter protein A